MRAGAEAERTALDVVSQAQRAFFMLRERRQMSDVLTNQLTLARRVVDSAAARYSSGTGSQIRAAQSMLNVAMGLPAATPTGNLAYSSALTELPSRASAEGIALSTRPELRMGEAEIDRALAEIQRMQEATLGNPAPAADQGNRGSGLNEFSS